MNKFSVKLNELRKEQGLTQSALAIALSVDRRSISNWEKAVREPDYDMLLKIAKYFEVSVDYLLGNEN